MVNLKIRNILLSTENSLIKFKVTSRSSFKNGFTVKMFVGSKNVGIFMYSLDPDIGPSHSVEVFPEYRNKGYGKLLLLKTIQIANDHRIGFESDSSMTKDQERVYDSLIRDNLIEEYLGSCKLTPKGEDTLEQAESESSVTSNFLHEKKSFIEKVKKKLNYTFNKY